LGLHLRLWNLKDSMWRWFVFNIGR